MKYVIGFFFLINFINELLKYGIFMKIYLEIVLKMKNHCQLTCSNS